MSIFEKRNKALWIKGKWRSHFLLFAKCFKKLCSLGKLNTKG